MVLFVLIAAFTQAWKLSCIHLHAVVSYTSEVQISFLSTQRHCRRPRHPPHVLEGSTSITMGWLGDSETRRLGDSETRRLGDSETPTALIQDCLIWKRRYTVLVWEKNSHHTDLFATALQLLHVTWELPLTRPELRLRAGAAPACRSCACV
jgi:hypothetical protein